MVAHATGQSHYRSADNVAVKVKPSLHQAFSPVVFSTDDNGKPTIPYTGAPSVPKNYYRNYRQHCAQRKAPVLKLLRGRF